ncbi:MAG TPA: VWA domain-containing protein [Vicinamibacterales bacterium]|nr:VWA domain-containing protein [Vicinamibacterales bacterium]
MDGRSARRAAAAAVAVVAWLLLGGPGSAAAPGQPPAQQTQPQTQPQEPVADQPLFRSGVKLVLVDVSVTGSGDEPIADLTPADFELTEDGVPQTVEQASLVQIDGQPRDNGEALPIRSREHAVAEAARDDVRIFAVFMDDYHLGRYPQEMLPLRKALADFIGSMMGPLDLVTVMNPITPLSALEWTRDRDALVRDLRTYEGRIDNFIGRSALEESQNLTRNVMRVRSQVVISALQALVMHLSGLREGRKTLLVVSRGIPLQFDISLEPDFQALLREANRGNVVIHTLDPRGLGQGVFVHDTLYRLANDTGGQAVVNTNDLSKGLERVIRDASHHYLIGYAPARELNDGKFHKIAVKVKRRGARTVARKGYWSPTAEEMAPAAAPALEPAVRSALTRLQSRQDDRVAHVSMGFAPGPNGTVRLTATWKPVPGFKDRPEHLQIEARTDGGPSLGTADAALGPDDRGLVTLDVPPGELLVRFSVAAAGGEIVDRWEAPIAVPDLSGATLAVASPVFMRARTTAAFQALRRGQAGRPIPDREFRTTDLVVVRTEVAGAAGDGDSQVTAEVLTREGKVLASLPASFATGHHQIDLPLRSLALGEYVLRFTAASGDASATATSAFAIIR